jgi:hypothetical protein
MTDLHYPSIPFTFPIILVCPVCDTQHIDKPDASTGWTNPPHRSHLCGACGAVWRPSDFPTVGVESIETIGKRDTVKRSGSVWIEVVRPTPPHINPDMAASMKADLEAAFKALAEDDFVAMLRALASLKGYEL